MTALVPVLLAWARDTGADLANVNGGAIAIGHPGRTARWSVRPADHV